MTEFVPLRVDEPSIAHDHANDDYAMKYRPGGGKNLPNGVEESLPTEAEISDYWKTVLADCESVPFPALPLAVKHPRCDKVIEQLIRHPYNDIPEIDISTIIYAAWALIVSRATSAEDVVFGVSRRMGREMPTIPMRIRQKRNQTVWDYLKLAHKHVNERARFEHVGLEQILTVYPEGEDACAFQTVLVMHGDGDTPSQDASEQSEGRSFAMVHDIWCGEGITLVKANFDSRLIELSTVQGMLRQLVLVVSQMTDAGPDKMISDIQVATRKDVEKIWTWNADVPRPSSQCAHESFKLMALIQPDAPAISAWDGELTYAQLDDLATIMAMKLVGMGVTAGVIVPLLFEKSKWTTVAVLGVLKAGGAFLILDPYLPEKRLQSIARDVKADRILCSASSQDLGLRLAETTVVIDDDFFTQLDKTVQLPLLYDTDSLMYVIYTSGSTGTPKGIMIDHQNLASTLQQQVHYLGLRPGSRVFDFSAYSFDMSIYNIFVTLFAGGCLCVPREEDRQNNLSKTIASSKADFLIITPSITQNLDPEDFANLETVLFIGEPLQLNHFSAWWHKVRVLNTYGPAECTPISTINYMATNKQETTGIGVGTGAVTWVVDPENHDLLVPIGCVGELVLEGPGVGKGYINDEEKTELAFIHDPVWMLLGSPGSVGRTGRVYKTGDLVKYRPDGTLVFVGRKDNQVKVNGQRVELGEIEHWVRKCVPNASQISIEVIAPKDGNGSPSLAAFLQTDDQSGSDLATPVPVPAEIEDMLAQHLPRHMIPKTFFSMNQIPLTPSGKTNRKELREIGSSFSAKELAASQAGAKEPKDLPTTQMEKKLQTIWASVLNIDPEAIGTNDSFLRLGGNSIDAMKIVSEARKAGIELTVEELFRHAKLGSVAEQSRIMADSVVEELPPFSVMGAGFDVLSLRDNALDPTKIVDAYPCTSLQEGLFSLSAKSPGDYVMQGVLSLSPDVSIDRFRDAWESVVHNTDILKTRIVQHQTGLAQVVVDERIEWIEDTDLDGYLKSDKEKPIGFAEPMARYALIKDPASSQTSFVWTVHHALQDGWSLPLMIDKVNRSYKGEEVTPQTGFNRFVKYINDQDQEEVSEFWKESLQGYSDTPFPALPPSVQQPAPDRTIQQRIAIPKLADSDITPSMLIRAAWALVAGSMANSEDVVFGAITHGRNVPVAGIEEILGPTMATVPVRINCTRDLKVSEYLDIVQQQSHEVMPFEQAGLQRIAKVSAEAEQACAFQTLLIVQPQDNIDVNALGEWQEDNQLESVNTYGLVLEAQLGTDDFTATARFDSQVIAPWMMEQLLQQVDSVLQQFGGAGADTRIGDVELFTERQLDQIWEWNEISPAPVSRCVHHLIEERAQYQPDDEAVFAWDGQLTYGELDDLSGKLASRLVEYGVRADLLVPLCFEKSMWTPVAMLAVLKAGGGFVLLDISLPAQRLSSIVDQIGTNLILSSTSNLAFSSGLVDQVIEVNLDTLSDLQPLDRMMQPHQSPSSAAFAVFTSGSTGTPKGIVLTHENVSSGLEHQSSLLGFEKDSRVYDFASYSFDIAVHNAITVFAAGGCLCIPSEDDRKNNINKSMGEMKITVADVTSSVSRLIDPAKVPDLKTLILAGEAVSADDAARWSGRAQVINAYGPAECGISTINASASNPEDCASIGKGAGLCTWVVDPQDHNILLPPGCTGELLLEGPLVGRGYLNEPEKTAAAFISDPKWLTEGSASYNGRQGRLYKTGDLVRYNEDGSLLFLGRKDDQVKIRGQRVELGEVEHRVNECLHHVEQVVADVIVPDGSQSVPMLVAFVQVDMEEPGPKMFSVNVDIKDQLAQHLPVYMIPTVFVAMKQLPIGATGKRNRKQLREIGVSFLAQETEDVGAVAPPKRQPETEMEWRMRTIWGRVLGLEPEAIGIDDSFFQLGGNSILAMRAAGEAAQAGIDLTVADIFRYSRLCQLASQACETPGSLQVIPRVEEVGSLKQSFAQERLWFIDQLHPGMASYLMPYCTRIRGPLNVNALSAALTALESRHETLRTTFSTLDGVGVQEVHPLKPRSIKVIDMMGCDETVIMEAVKKELETPFDLSTEPSWRASLYQLGAADYIFTAVMHHIISDGWSVDILAKELAAFYSASLHGLDPLSTSEPLPIRYRDYAVWQKQQRQQEEHQRQLQYWVDKLEMSRPAEFICDKPRPAALSGRANTKKMKLEGLAYSKLQSFCSRLEVTPFTVLLSAFRATHYRMTGQIDAIIGYPNANRDRWEVKGLIGFFVNLQCIRICLEDESFEELVRQVHEATVDSFAYQDTPFENIVAKLQKQRDLSRHPIVQLAFAVHSQVDLGRIHLEGVETEVLDQSETSQFDLEFHFFQTEGGLVGEVYYSADLFNSETIDTMLSTFQKLLDRAIDQPSTQIASLPLMDEGDHSQLESMGLIRDEPANYPRDLTVVELFGRQAATWPAKIAVKDSSSELTYAQLDTLSNNMANWLRVRSLTAETLVGVFSGQSCETIVAFLGILKANLAYLPLDVKTPAGRMETILSSIEGHKIIFFAKDASPPSLNLGDVEFVRIAEASDNDQSTLDYASMAPKVLPSPTGLAYVMFTSGSTGKPKGVMVEHRGIVRLAEGSMSQFLPQGAVMFHMINTGFDASTWEIYSTLLKGGTLICMDRMQVLDLKRLADTFSREGIHNLLFTPALLKECLEYCPDVIAALSTLYCGGDRLDPHDMLLARRLMKKGSNIINVYGPTENTGASAIYNLPEDEDCVNGVPVGRTMSGSGAYIMDPNQQLVPLGVLGELVVTGDGIARGYTDPQKDDGRFVTVSIDGQDVKAYRTGDNFRYRPGDGQLEFFGRIDGQVKVRGHRIELGEIEHVLRSHSAVTNAVAVLQGEGQNIQVVSFVTIGKDTEPSGEPDQVRQELQNMAEAQLPPYMVPGVIKALDKFPVNINGKVDRQALQTMVLERPVDDTSVLQPTTEMERQLQDVWGRVLNINPSSIGLDDNFFQLGGHSIAAMKVVSEARKAGLSLEIPDIFRQQTLRKVAGQTTPSEKEKQQIFEPFELLRNCKNPDPIIRDISSQYGLDLESIQDAYPCTPLQEGMFTLSLKRPGDYIMQATLELPKHEPIDKFCEAWETAVNALPILRTRIVEHQELGLLQLLMDDQPEWNYASRLDQYLENDRASPMNVGTRLCRFALIGDNNNAPDYFVWTIHHALYDGWSLQLMLKAVSSAFEGVGFEDTPQIQTFIDYIIKNDEGKASAYWQNALDDFDHASFPPLPASVQQPVADMAIDRTFPQIGASQGVTPSAKVRAAWALVVGRMTNSEDVAFGVTLSGRNAPVANIEKMVVPAIATVPVRVKWSSDQTVSEYLNSVQQQATDMIPFEQTGLHRISKFSTGCQQACDFRSLVLIQMEDSKAHLDNSIPGTWCGLDQAQWSDSYALVIEVFPEPNKTVIRASFDSRVLETWVAEALLERLGFVMTQFEHGNTYLTVGEIDTITSKDIEQIWDWNQSVPAAIDSCVDEMIEQQAVAQPNATAVDAWDGSLTYHQLDNLASQLSGRLMDAGVGPETLVPLCFEKSMWTPVASLAVLKAGGAFVLLDSTLPEQRLRSIVNQLGSDLILSSTANLALSSQLSNMVIEVSQASFSTMEESSRKRERQASSTAMYVVFTSGSTGQPKGVTITHENFSSLSHYQSEVLAYDRESRVFDFASYAFDVSVNNMFATFLSGGCVCIPSDDDRKGNIAQAMADLHATIAELTPSVARLIEPATVPELKTLLFSGEAMMPSDATRWLGKAQILNSYGPAECTITSTVKVCSSPQDSVLIGKGVGVTTWVVDPENHNSLMPLGCTGELLIEGPLVGRGYLNEPDKTAASFIENPPWLLDGGPGYKGRQGRLYKTGDLVSYNKDGDLVFVGRKDNQFKIRGQRIEVGEIEHWVQEYATEASRVVSEVIHLQGHASTVLAAFLQVDTELDTKGEGSDIRMRPIPPDAEDYLAQHLPSYMIPTVFVYTSELPIGNTGKTDRKKLRQIGASFSSQQLDEMRAASEGPKRQPTTEAEQQMQLIWAQVLDRGPESIGLDDSFFHLGGNSIDVMKVVGAARRIGLSIPVASIFQAPKLHQVAHRSVPAINGLDVIQRTKQDGPFVTSFAQSRLLFLEQLYPGMALYNMPCVVRLRGPLRIEALNAAIRALESRHESLRTTFSSQDDGDLQLIQPVNPGPRDVVEIFEEELMAKVREDELRPFDLSTEPGWRVSVYKIDNHHHVLSMVMHHIISDGWSLEILYKELAGFYSLVVQGQNPLANIGALPIQYKDYSVWQRQQDQIKDHQRQEQYWFKQLETSQPAELPCDKPRPAILSGKAEVQSFRIQGQLYDDLQEFCKTHGVTLFMSLLAAFRATQYRLTGQHDATIGVLNANRDRWEFKDIVGFFVNLQCLRTTVENDMSFKELVQQTRSVTIDSFANQDMPFENIVSRLHKGRDISRNPIAQICFAFHTQPDATELPLEGLQTEFINQSITTRFDVEFHLHQEEGSLLGEIAYSTDLYLPQTMENLASVFLSSLEVGLREPEMAVSSLPLLTDNACSQLKDLGLIDMPQTNYGSESSIIDVFRQQVPMHPDKLAVRCQSTQLTYAELDEQSDRLAIWLSKREYAPETIVGVFADRSCHTVVAFFGILKANLAYLPFDVKIPPGRFDDIMSSLPGDKLVLVGADVRLPSTSLQNVEFVPISEALLEGLNPESPLGLPGPSANSLAYVMFTSGSTGKPKGVMVEHRGIVRLVKHNNFTEYVAPSGAYSHLTSLSFDVSAWEIYGSLLNGLTLVCIDAVTALDDQGLAQTFIRENIRNASFTPVLLKHLIAEAPSLIRQLKTLYVAGDHFGPQEAHAAKGLMDGHVINMYGPTENSVYSTMYCIPDGAQLTTVPIGRTISNSGAYVMDQRQSLVPIGVVGELVLTGDGLARGYTDPQQNIDRFVSVMIDGMPTRAYRTGDYARYRPSDGLIDCLGRIDGQVKIRGQRVEIGEIDYALRCHECVTDSATVLQKNISGEAQLASFITVSRGEAASDEGESNRKLQEELFTQLRNKLPPYMVPQTITVLDKMPSTINGKVDRRALTEMVQQPQESPRSIRPPNSDLERQMQKIWSQVLGIEPDSIGLDDGFFQLGGNSITAMKLVAASRKADLNLSMQDVFRQDTLEALAKQCRQGGETKEDVGDVVLVEPDTKSALLTQLGGLDVPIQSTAVEDILPTTDVQESFVHMGEQMGEAANYFFLHLDSRIDQSRLEKCCDLTLERYPLLRSQFLRLQGRLWQVVLRQPDCPLRVYDVEDDLEQAGIDYWDKDCKKLRSTDVPTAFILLRHKVQGLRLIVRMSHTQYDGYSMATIFQSLMNADETEACEQSSFARFLSYAQTRRATSTTYWRDLLQGSPYTMIQPNLPALDNPPGDRARRIEIVTEIPLPDLPSKITLATLVSSAWGVLLSRLTGSEDVNFGHVVAGRNSGPPGVDKIVGPCLNYIPVRLKLPASQTTAQALLSIQEQFLAPDGADSLGFRDIIDSCTRWPTGSFYGSMIQHQNVNESPEIQTSEGSSRMTFYPTRDPHFVLPYLFMISHPKDESLEIKLVTHTHMMTEETAQRLSTALCKIIDKLCQFADKPLHSWVQDVELDI